MILLRNGKLWVLTLAHFAVDFFASASTLIIAVQTTPLNLTLGQVGTVGLLYSVTSSVTQPLFGWLADRVRGPVVALGGILWAAAFTALAGLMHTFTAFAIVASLAGLGVGAFHPAGAAGVSLVSGSHHRSAAMSIFLLGGTGAYFVGPMVAGIMLGRYGPHGTLGLGVLGLLAAPVLIVALFGLHYSNRPAPDEGPNGDAPGVLPNQTRPQHVAIAAVALLMAVILSRSWMANCLTIYLPQYFKMEGFSPESYGYLMSLFGFTGMFGNLAGGFLAGRVGPRAVLAGSLALSAPLIWFQFHTEGSAMVAVIAALGFFSTASLPLTVTLGQRLMPDRPGIMSGLTLGFAFVVGGIGTALTGKLADQVGLVTALVWLAPMTLLGGLLAIFLPGAGRPTQPPVTA